MSFCNICYLRNCRCVLCTIPVNIFFNDPLKFYINYVTFCCTAATLLSLSSTGQGVRKSSEVKYWLLDESHLGCLRADKWSCLHPGSNSNHNCYPKKYSGPRQYVLGHMWSTGEQAVLTLLFAFLSITVIFAMEPRHPAVPLHSDALLFLNTLCGSLCRVSLSSTTLFSVVLLALSPMYEGYWPRRPQILLGQLPISGWEPVPLR